MASVAIKAVRKRRHRLDRQLGRFRRRLHGVRVLRRPLRRLDSNPLPTPGVAEIRLFVVGGPPGPHLSSLLDQHDESGCDRAFLGLRATDGEVGALLERHPRAHAFARADDPRSDHEVLRHLLHHHGQGHWCLIVGANELLAASAPSLKVLCAQLETAGVGALRCRVIDRDDAPSSESWRSQQPATEGDLRQITTVARDPMTDRVFAAVVDVAGDASWLDGAAKPRTRVVLLRFRKELALAQDLRAVAGVREADSEGALLRFGEPLTTPAASGPAAR